MNEANARDWSTHPFGDPTVRPLVAAANTSPEALDDAPRDARGHILGHEIFDEPIAIAPPSPPEEIARPEIEVTPDEHIAVRKTIEALANRSDLYQRGPQLVTVSRGPSQLDVFFDKPLAAPRITPVASPFLREMCSESAWFFRWVKGEKEPQKKQVPPPAAVVAAVHARGMWNGIRPLECVSETPVMRPDGSVFDESGYDPHTGTFLDLSESFPCVPKRPTIEQAREALAFLFEPWVDFPFATPAHRAAAVAAVLTPLARLAFAGPSPLFLFDANTRGSGKSLGTDVVAEITTGRPMPRMSPARDDDEMRKRITALAISGVNMVLVDNVIGSLGGASLDAALTSPGTWRDRVLGESRDVEVPFRATWFATGNNVTLTGDTSRRVVHVRLESPEEHPEARTNFRYPHLLEWVRANRAALVMSGVTLLRAYIVAGKPEQRIVRWGSFESWARLVPSALVWAGAEDPGITREALQSESDTAAVALADLIRGWDEISRALGGRCTAAQVLDRLDKTPPDAFETLRAALGELCPSSPGKLPTARQVGNMLRQFKGRVVGGRALVGVKGMHGVAWKVASAARHDSDDSNDSVSTPHAQDKSESNNGSLGETPSSESAQSCGEDAP